MFEQSSDPGRSLAPLSPLGRGVGGGGEDAANHLTPHPSPQRGEGRRTGYNEPSSIRRRTITHEKTEYATAPTASAREGRADRAVRGRGPRLPPARADALPAGQRPVQRHRLRALRGPDQANHRGEVAARPGDAQ